MVTDQYIPFDTCFVFIAIAYKKNTNCIILRGSKARRLKKRQIGYTDLEPRNSFGVEERAELSYENLLSESKDVFYKKNESFFIHIAL